MYLPLTEPSLAILQIRKFRKSGEEFSTTTVGSRKLSTSGYNRNQISRIVWGIKGYEAQIRRAEGGGRRLYRTAQDFSKARRRKKLLGKREWFREG